MQEVAMKKLFTIFTLILVTALFLFLAGCVSYGHFGHGFGHGHWFGADHYGYTMNGFRAYSR